jgi:hypothetical protein
MAVTVDMAVTADMAVTVDVDVVDVKNEFDLKIIK